MIEPDDPVAAPDVLRRVPFGVAAAVSLATVILLLPFWVIGAIVLGGTGLGLMSVGRSEAAGRLGAQLASIGAGLTVGPVTYLALATFVAVVG